MIRETRLLREPGRFSTRKRGVVDVVVRRRASGGVYPDLNFAASSEPPVASPSL